MNLLADSKGCVDAQVDLGLRIEHIPEDTFSHGAVLYIFAQYIECITYRDI